MSQPAEASDLTPFHIAFPVRDIDEARRFYGGLMALPEGRSAPTWIDFDLFGHQIVAHLNPGMTAAAAHHNPVDGHDVPVPHFGVVLDMARFDDLATRLTMAGVRFVIAPYVRFKGEVGEQANHVLPRSFGQRTGIQGLQRPFAAIRQMTRELIRPARLHEREALEDLQLQASLMGPADRADLLANPDAIDLPAEQIADGNVYVCEADGRIVGFGVVLPRADGQAELDGLFVRPDVWGEGYGRLLLQHGEGLARAAGASELHAVVNAQALGFYSACGFEPAGQAQTRFKPAAVMIKRL